MNQYYEWAIYYFHPITKLLYHKSNPTTITTVKDTINKSDTLIFIKGDMKYTLILTKKKLKI